MDEFEAMIEAGAGLVVATVCVDGSPRVCRAWSAVVTDRAAGRMRVAVTADDPVTLENLEARTVALNAAHAHTLRSLQVTGRALRVEAPTDADTAEARRQTDTFFALVSATDGIAIELLHRIVPNRIVMADLQIDARYDQSPGPGAGSRFDDEGAT